MFVSFSVVCFQVDVSVTGQSLVQRSPTECGVSECDLQNSMMIRPCISISISIIIIISSSNSSSSSSSNSSSGSDSSNSNSSLALFHQQTRKITEYPVFFLQ